MIKKLYYYVQGRLVFEVARRPSGAAAEGSRLLADYRS